MPSTITDRTSGLGTGATANGENATVSQKVPCRVATTANITLSGLQTIDTVTVVADDRVLVKDQTDASENGIYLASADAWARTADAADAGDLVKGSQVRVNEGSTGQGLWYCTSSDPITIGTDNITWVVAALSSDYETYATRTALKAVASLSGLTAILTEPGREGIFVFTTGNYSSEITLDTEEGFYIKADDTASSSGAWVRQRTSQLSAVTWFGATGDGSTDDTNAFDGWARLIEDTAGNPTGEGLLLTPGHTYIVTNWKLPRFSSGPVRTYVGCPAGMATIKRKASGGTTTYMVAPAKWIDDVGFADTPMHFHNVVFDGNDACDVPLIVRNFQSLHEGCRFINGDVSACKFVRLASDGSTDSSSSMTNTKWVNCHFEAGASTTSGLLKTEDDGSGNAASDGFIINCTAQGNAQAPYCVDIVKGEGWKLTGNHFYNAVTKDLLVRNIGTKCIGISNNIFEEGGALTISGQTNGLIGPGNSWWEPLQINYTADANPESVTVNGDIFPKDKSGSTNSFIQNTGAAANKLVFSLNNTFFASSSSGGHSSSSSGLFIIGNAVTSGGFEPYVGAAAYTLNGPVTYGSDTELTVASGAVTVTKNYHSIDTESDAATDDLDTINGGTEGMVIYLVSADAARDTTLKDGTGNLRLNGDFALSSNQDTISLIYNGSAWLELSRSDNAT